MITMLGIGLMAILIILPLLAASVFRVDALKTVFAALVKMLVRVGVLGAAVYYLVEAGSVWLDVVFALVFIVYTIITVIVQAKLSVRTYLLPVCAGMFVALLVTGGLLYFINHLADRGLSGHFLLPVIALLSGSMVEPMAHSLSVYYMGLRHHNHLYYYLLGNGATRSEALNYLMKRAIEKSLVPGMRQMSGLVVGCSPVLMWTMIMCGVPVLDAAFFQVLIVLAVFAATVLSVVVAVWTARRYVVDGYARIKSEAVKLDNVTEQNTENNEQNI